MIDQKLYCTAEQSIRIVKNFKKREVFKSHTYIWMIDPSDLIDLTICHLRDKEHAESKGWEVYHPYMFSLVYHYDLHHIPALAFYNLLDLLPIGVKELPKPDDHPNEYYFTFDLGIRRISDGRMLSEYVCVETDQVLTRYIDESLVICLAENLIFLLEEGYL